MEQTKTYTALAMAGTIPFIAAALLPILGLDSLPNLGPLEQVAASYGLAIVCFLAGAQWGTYLAGRYVGSLNLFFISNAIFLAAWFAYIGASIKWALSTQVLALLVLFIIDLRFKKAEVISAAYFRMRIIATLVAISSLLAVIAQ